MDFSSSAQLGHMIFALTAIPSVLVMLVLVGLWTRAIRRGLAQKPVTAPVSGHTRLVSRVSMGMAVVIAALALYVFGVSGVLSAIAAPLH